MTAAGTIEQKVARFALDCPCEACRRWRERTTDGTPQERILRGLEGNLEDNRHKWSDVEILWTARFVLRGAHDEFLSTRNPVKRFAAVCPCPRCQGWRNRFLEQIEAAELYQIPRFLELTAGEEESP